MVLADTSLHDPKTVLLVLLATLAAVFIVVWVRHLRRSPRRGGEVGSEPGAPSGLALAVGAVTDFFDTLGIGSFATTTSLFKLLRMVPDRLIPGTLNVGHALPSVAQALIFIAIVEVDTRTLVLMIGASVLGAWFGAGVVCGVAAPAGAGRDGKRAARRRGAHAAAAPPGNARRSRRPVALRRAPRHRRRGELRPGRAHDARHRALRAVHDSGQPPRHERPGRLPDHDGLVRLPDARRRACASSRADAYAPRAALGLTLGGTPAVLVAAFVVKSLSLDAVRLLVLVVVVYTAVAMLRSAMAMEAPQAAEARDAPERAAGEA